jgi:mannose-6-phosphate isomerase class I
MSVVKVTENRISEKWEKSIKYLCDTFVGINARKKIVIDGYPGVDWSFIQEKDFALFDFSSVYKDRSEIWEIIQPFLDCDTHFGRIFRGSLRDLIDEEKMARIAEAVEGAERALVYGCGSSMLRDYSSIYIDMTREEFLSRIKNLWFLPPQAFEGEGAADIGLSIQEFKLSHYICYPIFDAERRRAMKRMNFYVTPDGKMLSRKTFYGIMDELLSGALRLRPQYIPGPWGGRWIKEMRGLNDLKNCAWDFEAVAPDMELVINCGKKSFILPFITILSAGREELMGNASKRFGWLFPLRVHYDDSWDGGNMAIQVHPNERYVRDHFNESIGQHEAYYIIKAKKNSKVFLGLRENTDVEEFEKETIRARDEKMPLDYERYVNSMQSRPEDLFIIPSGTVHALGKDQVCLEIGTSYGYTFHIYDYLRPDLRGKMREIHAEHAFRALKNHRERWVEKNLRPEKRRVRSFDGGEELLIGTHSSVPFEVRRLDFDGKAEENTAGDFHILTLIKGNSLKITSKTGRSMKINFSESVLIPASLGRYDLSGKGCSVLKVCLRAEI